MRKDKFLGEIKKSITYHVSCAVCSYHWSSSLGDEIDNQKDFIKSIRKMGWRQIERRWVCPAQGKDN